MKIGQRPAAAAAAAHGMESFIKANRCVTDSKVLKDQKFKNVSRGCHSKRGPSLIGAAGEQVVELQWYLHSPVKDTEMWIFLRTYG